MKELSSVSNPIVKAAAELKQKKLSDRTAGFLVEGMRSVEEAVNCGIVKQLFVLKGSKTASARQTAIIVAAAAEGVELYEVTEPVMQKNCRYRNAAGSDCRCCQTKCGLRGTGCSRWYCARIRPHRRSW